MLGSAKVCTHVFLSYCCMVERPREKVCKCFGLNCMPWLENQFVGSVQCSSLCSLLTFTNTYLRDGVPLATYDANSLWSSWLACWAQRQKSRKLVWSLKLYKLHVIIFRVYDKSTGLGIHVLWQKIYKDIFQVDQTISRKICLCVGLPGSRQ